MLSTTITIPRHLKCPVTEFFFLQPVVVWPSAHVFEKEVIEQLIKQSTPDKPATCPLSRLPIQSYKTAWAIADAVNEFIRDNPGAEEEQYKRKNPEISTTQTVSSSTASTSGYAASSGVSDANQADKTLLQIQADEVLARELAKEGIPDRNNPARGQADLQISRREPSHPGPSSSFFQAPVHRTTLASSSNLTTEHLSTIRLSSQEKGALNTLISDLKNLVYALQFERGPLPRNPIQNDSLLVFAFIAQIFVDPLPWQKIVVKEGPKTDIMYEMLKTAIRALEELKPSILEQARSRYAGQFDVVKTMFAGERSLSTSGYAAFAKHMGTIQDQPGYLVDQILTRVNTMLSHLKQTYNIEPEATPDTLRSFAR